MPDDKYFAAAPTSEIGAKLYARVENYGSESLVSDVFARTQLAYKYYYGLDASGVHATSAVHRGGQYGELAEVRVNHARSLVNTVLNLIVAPKFAWQPKATNMDYDSVRETLLASSVLEYYWEDRQVEKMVSRAVEEALALTEGFVLLEWDDQMGDDFAPDPMTGQVVKSGDLRFTNISTWDVIRDPNKKGWDELDWTIVRVYRNRYDLAARYSKNSDVIINAPIEGQRDYAKTGIRTVDTDDIPVYLFFHKPCAALPTGRQTVFLQTMDVLADSELQSENIPLHRVTPAELIRTPFGYSPLLEVLGIQELMDSLHTSVATNQTTFGTQLIALEQGSEINPDQIGVGMSVIYYPPGKKPPEALQLTKSPPEVFGYLDSLRRDQELLFGVNSVVRGSPPENSRDISGAALALLQSQAVQQSSVLQSNYLRLIADVGTCIIDMLKRHCKVPRKIALVGKQNKYLVNEEEYSGSNFGRIKKVLVEVGNPLSQTAAGRVTIADTLAERALLRTPEQYIQVLETGRLDPVTSGVQDELMLILSENEDMGKGMVPQALIHDDAVLHCKEHRSVLASPNSRRDPNVLQAAIAHIHQHYSFFYGVPVEMVEQDPMYRERMLFIMGLPPPPPMPGMMGPGDPNAPPSGPGGGPPPPAGPQGPLPPIPSQNAAVPPGQMPSMPNNPATGQDFVPAAGPGPLPR